MGVRTITYMATEQSQALGKRPKKAASPPYQQRDIVLDDMPFISFEQPGRDSDGEKQKIIRKHLGRRRKKLTPQRAATGRIGKDSKQDLLSLLCICCTDLSEFLRNAASDRRNMVLESCTECGKPRLVESSMSVSSSLVASPIVPILDNFADPFAMLPINSSPNMHSLIRHFLDVTAPSTVPIPELAPLFPNIAVATSLMAHDRTLLQCVLSLSSMHLEYLQGSQSPSAATLEERGKAITLLNQSLINPHPTDGLIVSIAILGSCEMVAGNRETWRAHILGLRNLLQMRGGLKSQDLIRDAVLEVDAVGTAVFMGQPYLSSYVDVEVRNAAYAFSNLPYEFISIDAELRQTFVAMRALSLSMEVDLLPHRHRASNPDQHLMNDFAATRSIIEYRLLTFGMEADAEADEDSPYTDAATQVLTLAAQIYTYLVFRKMSPGSIIHENLGVRLRQAIMAFDREASSQHATCLLLWAAVMGSLATSTGSSLRLWFLGWMAHCVSELDVSELGDLKYQLSKVVWVDEILGLPCKNIWVELEEMHKIGVEVRFVTDE